MHDNTKSKEQKAPTSGVHNRGDTAEKDDVTISSNENTETDHVVSEGQLKCNSEAADAGTPRGPRGEVENSQAEACNLDMGQSHTVNEQSRTKPVFGVFDQDRYKLQAIQPQKMARGLKLWI